MVISFDDISPETTNFKIVTLSLKIEMSADSITFLNDYYCEIYLKHWLNKYVQRKPLWLDFI